MTRDNAVEVGQILAGKYRVERILGAGGMGVVVAVLHVHLDQRFAIKLMLPDMLGSEEGVARFMREARAAAKIKSQHVVRVFDVDALPNGAPYLVMELLEGHDLASELRLERPLSIDDAVDIILQTCEVVADAHALGIVHRDLKPANLFVCRGRGGHIVIKVLDFGISKVTATEDSSAEMTKTSTTMGSPLYMSPEQIESARDVDGRTDIWALGVILYQLVTKQLPFPGKTPIEVGIKILGSSPRRPLDLRQDIPPALDAVILRCLERDPARRFVTAGALVAALAPFAPDRSRALIDRVTRGRSEPPLPNSALTDVTTRVLPPSDGGTKTALPGMAMGAPASAVVSDSSTMRTAPPIGATAPPRRRRRWGAGIVVGSAVAFLAIAWLVMLARSPATSGAGNVNLGSEARGEPLPSQVATATQAAAPEAEPSDSSDFQRSIVPLSAATYAAPHSSMRLAPAAPTRRTQPKAQAAAGRGTAPAASAPQDDRGVWMERK